MSAQLGKKRRPLKDASGCVRKRFLELEVVGQHDLERWRKSCSRCCPVRLVENDGCLVAIPVLDVSDVELNLPIHLVFKYFPRIAKGLRRYG